MIYYDDDKAYYKTQACKYTLLNILKCYGIDICPCVLFSIWKSFFQYPVLTFWNSKFGFEQIIC